MFNRASNLGALMHGFNRFILEESATIYTPAYQGNSFQVTLTGNRTLGKPDKPGGDGQSIIWRVIQGAGGNHTLAYDASFIFGDTISSITLSTAAGAIDYIGAIYSQDADVWHVIALAQGF